MTGDEHDANEPDRTPSAGEDAPAKDGAEATEAGTSARFRKDADAGDDPTPAGADYS